MVWNVRYGQYTHGGSMRILDDVIFIPHLFFCKHFRPPLKVPTRWMFFLTPNGSHEFYLLLMFPGILLIELWLQFITNTHIYLHLYYTSGKVPRGIITIRCSYPWSHSDDATPGMQLEGEGRGPSSALKIQLFIYDFLCKISKIHFFFK